MVKPFVEVIEGDCLTVMPTLETQSVDLVLVDVPYGSTQNEWDQVIEFKPMKFRPVCWQAMPVVPLPMQKSSTVSPSLV